MAVFKCSPFLPTSQPKASCPEVQASPAAAWSLSSEHVHGRDTQSKELENVSEFFPAEPFSHPGTPETPGVLLILVNFVE